MIFLLKKIATSEMRSFGEEGHFSVWMVVRLEETPILGDDDYRKKGNQRQRTIYKDINKVFEWGASAAADWSNANYSTGENVGSGTRP